MATGFIGENGYIFHDSWRYIEVTRGGTYSKIYFISLQQKHLVYRHILKPIVKKLEEKNQKFSLFGTWINFNQVCSSHAICRAAHPWYL